MLGACARFRCATALAAAMLAILPRVSLLALAMCGTKTTLSRSASPDAMAGRDRVSQAAEVGVLAVVSRRG